jgi:tRNA-modifying protein YgfZ
MNEQLLFPSEPSVYHLHNFTVIRLEGPDAVKYLNGQVTCDVTALASGQSTLGAHCNPKGKVIAVFRLFKQNEDLLMLYKKELTNIQLAELKKYAVFSKVTISDISEQFSIMGIAGTGTDKWIHSHQPIIEQIDAYRCISKISQDRWLFLAAKTDLPCISLPEAASSDWQGLDILDGIPQVNQNNQTEFIPQALNLQALSAISFTKGCYTGQEIVARAKYRGINNRSVFILKGTTSLTIDSNHSIERKQGEHWRRTGTVLDVWQQQSSILLSVVLPSDTTTDASFRIENDASSSLTIHPLPYLLD